MYSTTVCGVSEMMLLAMIHRQNQEKQTMGMKNDIVSVM